MGDFKQLIGERIAAARKASGLTVRELCERIPEFKQSRISHWENGTRTPGPKEISMLASVLKTSASYLMGLSNINETLQHKEDFFNLIPYYDHEEFIKYAKQKPVLGEKFIPLDNFHARHNSKKLFALKAWDNSMIPIIHPDDLLIAETTSNPTPGNLIITIPRNSSKILIRKFRDSDTTGMTLLAENPDWPSVHLSDLNEYYLWATIIEHRKYYRP